MTIPTVTIRGKDGRKAVVNKLGYGLMGLTSNGPLPNERTFKSIDSARLPGPGLTVFNSAEFYGKPEPTGNLALINKYMAQNPSAISSTFLAVKGGMELPIMKLQADSSPLALQRSFENSLSVLRGDQSSGWKKIDCFQPARLDTVTPIETVMETLGKMVDEGKVDFIGLSEVGSETIRRANKVFPVSLVEVEYSPWCIDIEKNGTLDTCRELGIPILAYSPIGRGFLTGGIKKVEDLNPFMKMLPRFQPEVFENNLKIVDAIAIAAKKKGCTPAQLCVAWLMAQDDLIIPIPGSSRPEGVVESIGALEVNLTSEDLQEIRKLVDEVEVKGDRLAEVQKQRFGGQS